MTAAEAAKLAKARMWPTRRISGGHTQAPAM
jgi:hypothetical protein